MVVGLLLLALLALVAATLGTRRPPVAPVPELDGYLRRWTATHDGYDVTATRLLHGWLALIHRVARPAAVAGVRPDVVTVWTVWLALVAVAFADLGRGWAVTGGVVLVASGVGDALDGAVAVLTGRATTWGYVLDSVVDRLNEALYLIAAWVAGAPGWTAIASGVAFGLLEYLRARAANVGGDRVPVITVGERPQRVVCCAIAVGMAGLAPAHATALAGSSLVVLLVLSVTGLVQLGVAVRRNLDRGTTSAAE